jgi:DNA-directed RNA polymerase
MRKTVNECNSTIDDLSFWAVHDAFGTHACDVETMVGIVKRTFHDIHRSLDFEGWIGPRSKDLKLGHILDSEYIID